MERITYSKAAAITPADGANLAAPTRALLVGVAGAVTVDMVEGGSNVALTLPAGIHPLRVKKVYSTGTTATGLVGLT